MDKDDLVGYLQKEYDYNTRDADEHKGLSDSFSKERFMYYAGRAEQVEDILKKIGEGVGA